MKTRLDIYLVENNFASGRDKAKALIMSGCVFVNNQKADKAGLLVSEDDVIEVRGGEERYVSRGGYKLEKAVNSFNLKLEGLTCMDIGASSGGFTDCMLQNGAKKVYAVDVGYGQLAWSLRNDSRVVVMERTNIRYVKEEDISEKLDFVSIDVSFISLKLVLPVAHSLLKDGGQVVCLVKPQFEAGREKVGKGGVVKEKSTHIEVIQNVISAARSIGFNVSGIDYSPIKGPKGNIEYLLLLKKESPLDEDFSDKIRAVVDEAHINAK